MSFIMASERDILEGRTTDVYFERTLNVLKSRGMEGTRVYAEVTVSGYPPSYKWIVYAGLREVVKLLKGRNVTLYSIHEGAIITARDADGIKIPVMAVEGPYAEFTVLETPLLGFLAAASGVATKAARVRKAAGDKPVISFGARRTHPAIAPFTDYYAYIGGCDGVSCVKAAEYLGIQASGTMPHSLMIIFKAVRGDHTEAWLAFDQVVPPSVPRIILADTFWDEVEEAATAARLLGGRLWGVRLDTPGSRRGSMEDIVREVRWKLSMLGFPDVKILVSGGLDESSIPRLAEAGADAFGVGSAISTAPFIDYALDIVAVEVEGRWVPIAKRGKYSGRKQVYQCENCLRLLVKPWGDQQPSCPMCGVRMNPILKPVIVDGVVVEEPATPQETRSLVIRQLEKVEL